MPTPSLLIVPARFKSGKLYSQIPTSGAGDFTVTRATAATRVNASGYIESVASGIPRLDYFASGGTVGCPALLVEPSGSNLALQSEDFNTTWTKDATTVTVNSIASPDGFVTADTIVASGTTGRHDVNQLISVASGSTYTVSAFFKKKNTQYVYLSSLSSGVGGLVVFDLDSGTFTQQTTFTGSVQSYGSGWFRVSARFTAGASVVARIRFGLTSSSTSDSSTLTTADDVYLWGAQLETGSVATSYIPTTTAAVTRNADVVSVSGAVSGSIGQQSGTIYCEFQFNTPTRQNAGVLSVESTNNQNRILLWHNQVTNALAVQLRANNSNVFNTSIGTLTNGQFYKIAIGYSSENTKVYLNGNLSAVITNTSAYTMAAALSRICLGNYEDSAALATFSRIRSFALYPERLSDDQMIALTTL